ncbi:exported hypothetical protein [Candidatus Terasakiella magnetica]|nr:exported hypothetical protein [Candidatus Terasakiella magnetica]
MSLIRRAIVAFSCLLAATAGPARAQEADQPVNADTELIDTVVDHVGGFLKALVGPPISSPSPYLNMPQAAPSTAGDNPAPAEPAKQSASLTPTPAPSPPIPIPAIPEPPPPTAEIAAPPPAVTAPTPPALTRAAASKPAAMVHATATRPLPIDPPSGCPVRIAATATLEQMRKLPPCK